jgi:glycosyltransferase involved in cell wall biosynthesis
VPHERAADVYSRCDAVVVPSQTTPRWREQFGRVVIEALACGVPVLASDSGELPALVSRTGGGWTFPEGDSASLARQIDTLARDRGELKRRGAAGRVAVEREFDLDALADRFADVVAEAVARRRAG